MALFQSTPSTQRETGWLYFQLVGCAISIHSLYAEGDGPPVALILCKGGISIHSLYAEGDGLLWDYYTLADLFQSTPSTQRETEAGISTE